MTTPSWNDILPTPPRRGQLKEMWITTYDQPDASLLVEHLLPSLLGMSYSLSHEVQERALFFGELGTTLEALHGRLTVISSPLSKERASSQYPWLWRYMDHFTVGAVSNVVQHAKLWAFHWKVDQEELIELHISSTNITSSAFKAQIQAGWHVMIPLGKTVSKGALNSWGMLIDFLYKVGAAAGAVADTRFKRLVALLSRANCPDNVTFVASIPGDKSAASQLSQFKSSNIHVLVPTVGEWNKETLSAWCKDLGVAPNKVHLKWISTRHPWAANKGWKLSNKTNSTLKSTGVRVECFPNEERFTKEHRDADSRWSHAKLYFLRSRRKLHLLVTSANWSLSAWGAGNKSPSNFELGVAFESIWTDLEGIGGVFNPPGTAPFCDDDGAEDEVRPSHLGWAEATWDGKRIELQARSTDTSTQILSTVCFFCGDEQELSLVDGAAAILWGDQGQAPVTARFTQGSESLEVNIIDLRPPIDFAKTPLPEVDDPAVAKALRDAFLLQRYGGPAVDPESIPGLASEHRPPDVGVHASDYSVKAWIDARAAFSVVDQWRAALAEAVGEPEYFDRVRLDGDGLRALYSQREGPAAGLVAEEFGRRLDEAA